MRWNATRHSISSPKPVVPGIEEQEDWESHRDGIMENLSPVGHLEITQTLIRFFRLFRTAPQDGEAQLNAYLECVKKASIKAASSKATWEELASEGGRDPLKTLAAGREVD